MSDRVPSGWIGIVQTSQSGYWLFRLPLLLPPLVALAIIYYDYNYKTYISLLIPPFLSVIYYSWSNIYICIIGDIKAGFTINRRIEGEKLSHDHYIYINAVYIGLFSWVQIWDAIDMSDYIYLCKLFLYVVL